MCNTAAVCIHRDSSCPVTPAALTGKHFHKPLAHDQGLKQVMSDIWVLILLQCLPFEVNAAPIGFWLPRMLLTSSQAAKNSNNHLSMLLALVSTFYKFIATQVLGYTATGLPNSWTSGPMCPKSASMLMLQCLAGRNAPEAVASKRPLHPSLHAI